MSKPTVHYMGKAEVVLNRAFLYPLDHPDEINVSNTSLVRTSAIVDYDPDTGRIETKNTIYIPES